MAVLVYGLLCFGGLRFVGVRAFLFFEGLRALGVYAGFKNT